ncbi:MAG: ABC transporter permease [Planctomycetales bacterium]|nr:ABC transporter permease [bacterium]UNM09617.1 MAG: ABC transporter permease [Planctomycetales bacterium]
MIIFEVIRMAVRGVRANLLRSMLTTLGIAVGVGCVVTLIAYSAGNTKQLLDQFSGFGTKSMSVSLENRDTSLGLTIDDAAALRREIPVLQVAAATLFFANVDLELNGAAKSGVTLTAVEPEYFKARTFELSSGRYFSQNDNLSMQQQVVIGANVKDELFMNLDPIGQQLLIQGKPFEVIGVMARRDEGRHGGSNDEVLVPPYTALVEFPTMDPMVNIDIEVKDEKYLEFAKTRVTEVLEARHPEIVLAKNERWSPLNIWMFNDWLKRRTAAANSMSRFLLVIGLLCLTIGAVGVMNIMLVAVEERTLEIGLRKALGATRPVIIGQFLSESLIVCLSGGAIGLGVAIVACAKMAALPDDANVPDPLLSQSLMVGAILVSLVIALAAGTWPAVLASSTDPIESLSYE